jgi:glycosyltransferase involved in cell wall biosynthesis
MQREAGGDSAMIDVLVTCFPHGDSVSLFPQVRGYYLARHLARAGLRAEFRQLPLPGLECEVLICSEYQCEMHWFERHLARPFGEIRADRWFCLVDESLHGRPDHFSNEVCRWFASRGGVLCHTADGELEPYEHWIGLGIDSDVVRPAADGQREHVLFDFPRSQTTDTAATFDVETLDVLRQQLPEHRLIGSGPADAIVRAAFDSWLEYGQPHARYVAAAFARALAVVPGCTESLGMAIAEAQVAGTCVVASADQVPGQLLVPEATVGYMAGDATSLARALRTAKDRDATRIREQARQRFNFADVVARTRAAIEL